jgi:protein TonB
MAALAPIAPPPASVKREPPSAEATPLFASVVGRGLAPTRSGRASTLAASLILHAMLFLLIVVVPLVFFEDILPVPGDALRAFFVAPPQAAPPPPPPPPAPPAGARALRRAPAAARPPEPPTFVAPIEVPDALVEEALDLDLQAAGVPGGVEGGVPGGVVGGIVGGLPAEAPPAPKVVRIGGKIVAPRLVDVVKPEYPMLATQARLKGIVILEALVGIDGRVKEVKPLRGHVLLTDAAIEAVKQWRYMPLLLNGAPVDFILTVTINFNLREATVQK